ncbi:MAG: histidine triad nucleotide-binding protein [Candidatus Hydrogenedentes bacterium]|nr:histidine triad nucleotide-binding protein [Candidatus Hydrogenedentota bacterium]
MADDCIFCSIANGDIPSEKVYENDEFCAFRDINPGAPVHILVIPKQHIERITDVTPDSGPFIGRMILVANRIVQDEGISDSGFRYVINCNRDGGQEVYHIHMHILGGRHMGWPPG